MGMPDGENDFEFLSATSASPADDDFEFLSAGPKKKPKKNVLSPEDVQKLKDAFLDSLNKHRLAPGANPTPVEGHHLRLWKHSTTFQTS